VKSSSGWNMSPMRNTASSHDEVPSVDRAAFLGSRCSLSTAGHNTPFTGTWKLNGAMSTFKPGRSFKSFTLTFTPDGTRQLEPDVRRRPGRRSVFALFLFGRNVWCGGCRPGISRELPRSRNPGQHAQRHLKNGMDEL